MLEDLPSVIGMEGVVDVVVDWGVDLFETRVNASVSWLMAWVCFEEHARSATTVYCGVGKRGRLRH